MLDSATNIEIFMVSGLADQFTNSLRMNSFPGYMLVVHLYRLFISWSMATPSGHYLSNTAPLYTGFSTPQILFPL